MFEFNQLTGCLKTGDANSRRKGGNKADEITMETK